MGIINWCDEKITELKQKGIKFLNGRPQIPINMRYDEIPECIETYQFRNEIPESKRKQSLICFYSMENRLWPRLMTIDKDAEIFKMYGGIVGMDISPSVNMLEPRQLHSILINCIYDCLIALRGIKVAINSRIGDLKSMKIIQEYPKQKTIVFGNLGCKGIFADYSFYQFKRWLEVEKPKNICVYGTFSKFDLKRISKIEIDLMIYFYQGHNYSHSKDKKSVFAIRGSKYTVNNPRNGHVQNLILSHEIKKINPCLESEKRGGDYHGSKIFIS